jgi:hypothetical protein
MGTRIIAGLEVGSEKTFKPYRQEAANTTGPAERKSSETEDYAFGSHWASTPFAAAEACPLKNMLFPSQGQLRLFPGDEW